MSSNDAVNLRDVRFGVRLTSKSGESRGLNNLPVRFPGHTGYHLNFVLTCLMRSPWHRDFIVWQRNRCDEIRYLHLAGLLKPSLRSSMHARIGPLPRRRRKMANAGDAAGQRCRKRFLNYPTIGAFAGITSA